MYVEHKCMVVTLCVLCVRLGVLNTTEGLPCNTVAQIPSDSSHLKFAATLQERHSTSHRKLSIPGVQ